MFGQLLAGNFIALIVKKLAPNMKLVIGCNYHTTWQRNKGMRFVLSEIKGDKVRLTTRNTGKDFWTNAADLIFIETKHNKNKAIRLQSNHQSV